MGANSIKLHGFVGDISAAADYLAPGAIEINRYQQEIFDKVRRRFPFGQRIQQVMATGHPSRYFEQMEISVATNAKVRVLSATATGPKRVERYVTLKALIAQINYSLFDIEVAQQQGQFAYLEAKDLNDTIDGVLKLHDQNLWTGDDSDLLVPATDNYFGVSGQIVRATQVGSYAPTYAISSTASLIDGVKTATAQMIARKDFEVRPTAFYSNPLFLDLFDQEAKTLQLYYNEVEIIPGVITKAIPTRAGNIPLIDDPAIDIYSSPGSLSQYTGFLLSEEDVEYHWLTSPVPRVFQLGLVGNLASQYVVVKFGAPVVKGPGYSHRMIIAVR